MNCKCLQQKFWVQPKIPKGALQKASSSKEGKNDVMPIWTTVPPRTGGCHAWMFTACLRRQKLQVHVSRVGAKAPFVVYAHGCTPLVLCYSGIGREGVCIASTILHRLPSCVDFSSGAFSCFLSDTSLSGSSTIVRYYSGRVRLITTSSSFVPTRILSHTALSFYALRPCFELRTHFLRSKIVSARSWNPQALLIFPGVL